MGEIVPFSRLVDKYSEKHGNLPSSYYDTLDVTMHGYVPSAPEIDFFLSRGEIWQDGDRRRGKTVRHIIPQALQEVAYNSFEWLREKYTSRVGERRNRKKEVIGAKVELLGTYVDSVGRAIVEGIMGEDKRIQQINYVQRRVWLRQQDPPGFFSVPRLVKDEEVE